MSRRKDDWPFLSIHVSGLFAFNDSRQNAAFHRLQKLDSEFQNNKQERVPQIA